MDRLEKIKGYADRLPADDAKWLVAEVTRLRTAVRTAEIVLNDGDERIARLTAELAELRDPPPDRCPCLNPTDHAGWCPRR